MVAMILETVNQYRSSSLKVSKTVAYLRNEHFFSVRAFATELLKTCYAIDQGKSIKGALTCAARSTHTSWNIIFELGKKSKASIWSM